MIVCDPLPLIRCLKPQGIVALRVILHKDWFGGLLVSDDLVSAIRTIQRMLPRAQIVG